MSLERKAKLSVILERQANLKLNREIKQALYHRVNECETRMVAKIHAARSALMGLFRGLAGPLNLDEDRIKIGEGRLLEILNELAR